MKIFKEITEKLFDLLFESKRHYDLFMSMFGPGLVSYYGYQMLFFIDLREAIKDAPELLDPEYVKFINELYPELNGRNHFIASRLHVKAFLLIPKGDIDNFLRHCLNKGEYQLLGYNLVYQVPARMRLYLIGMSILKKFVSELTQEFDTKLLDFYELIEYFYKLMELDLDLELFWEFNLFI